MLGGLARLRGARRSAAARLAFSTDSFVVRPLFFPGGSIGDLAVNGTVNDLAMSGAHAGVPLLRVHPRGGRRAVGGRRGRRAARARPPRGAGVEVVTGDTKVVDAGHGDGIYINTAGVGLVPTGVRHPARSAPARATSSSSAATIGVHGVAIMSVREGLEFGTEVESDCAPLDGLVAAMLAVTPDLHVLRDPTRGGLATALNEIAEASGVGVELDESAAPGPRGGRQRLRLPRAGPAVRRQRGQAGGLRAARATRTRYSRRCARTRWARTRR